MICTRGEADDLAVVVKLLDKPDALSPEMKRKVLELLTDAAVTRKVKPSGDLVGAGEADRRAGGGEGPALAGGRRSGWRRRGSWARSPDTLRAGHQRQSRASHCSRRHWMVWSRSADAKSRQTIEQLAAGGQVDGDSSCWPSPAWRGSTRPRPRQPRRGCAERVASRKTTSGRCSMRSWAARKGRSKLAEATASRSAAGGRREAGPAAHVFGRPQRSGPVRRAQQGRRHRARCAAAVAGRSGQDRGRGEPEGRCGPRREDFSPGRSELHEVPRRRRRPAAASGRTLSPVGSISPVDYVVNSILNPNLAIKEQFVTRRVLTVDGEVLTGIQIDRDDQRLRLRDAAGKVVTVPIDNIDQEGEGKSLMPQGLTKFLTRAGVFGPGQVRVGAGQARAVRDSQDAQHPAVARAEESGAGVDRREFPTSRSSASTCSTHRPTTGRPPMARSAAALPLAELAPQRPAVLYLQGEIEVSQAGVNRDRNRTARSRCRFGSTPSRLRTKRDSSASSRLASTR